MNPEQQAQFAQMQQTINEMNAFISNVFNSDGTLKNPQLVIEANDNVTTPAGTIRIQTNLGPRNVLVAA